MDTPSGNIPVGQPVSMAPAAPSTPSTTSTLSVMALILGILSLTCCGFLSGIPAIFIGRSELKLIEQGKVPESNRTIAKIGMILGIAGTALSLLMTAVYIVLIALGISTGMMHGN